MDLAGKSSSNFGCSLDDAVSPENGFLEEVWRPSDTVHLGNLITTLSKRLEPALAEKGFESPELRIRTVLEEMAVNAWLHGNKENPHKAIVVRWRCGGEEFQLEVKDEGPGFDPKCAPDPTTAENLTKPCGRGIFIIKYFSDQVIWGDKGRKVIAIMKKPFVPGT